MEFWKFKSELMEIKIFIIAKLSQRCKKNNCETKKKYNYFFSKQLFWVITLDFWQPIFRIFGVYAKLAVLRLKLTNFKYSVLQLILANVLNYLK